MRIRTLLGASVVSLAALHAAPAHAQDEANATLGPVNPLKGAMADLGVLLGTWSATDFKLAPDGTVAGEESGVIVRFVPALAGSYMFLHIESRHVIDGSQPMVWVITHDPDQETYVARGFGANDPHAALAHASWDGRTFTIERAPETNVPPMNFRFTLDLDGDSTINVSFEIQVEDQWMERSRGLWTRLD